MHFSEQKAHVGFQRSRGSIQGRRRGAGRRPSRRGSAREQLRPRRGGIRDGGDRRDRYGHRGLPEGKRLVIRRQGCGLRGRGGGGRQAQGRTCERDTARLESFSPSVWGRGGAEGQESWRPGGGAGAGAGPRAAGGPGGAGLRAAGVASPRPESCSQGLRFRTLRVAVAASHQYESNSSASGSGTVYSAPQAKRRTARLYL